MTCADELIELAHGLSAASVHEAAGRIGALPSFIKPLASHVTVSGRAFPISCPPGDNLVLHHALYAARPGEVLVVDCGDGREFGYWGEVMAVAAQAVAIAGIVITGGVRDQRQMLDLGFPVFAGNVCIRGTGKDPRRPSSIGAPITLGDVIVHRGDLVVGDGDGVVIVPAQAAHAIASEARARDRKEEDIFQRLRTGATTLEIYQLPNLETDLSGSLADAERPCPR